MEHADLCSALSADALCHFVTKQPTLLIEKADRLQSTLALYFYTVFLSPTQFFSGHVHCFEALHDRTERLIHYVISNGGIL